MDFQAFDTSKIDEYSKRAKEQWGKTPAYQEFEEKMQKRTPQDDQIVMKNFMKVFEEFGQMKEMDPAADLPQKQVKKLQAYITEYFYECTNQILECLGKMYSGGGEFTNNIDQTGGEGTAIFTDAAIQIYCQK